MANNHEQNCPKCGQRLRFPDHIGGMLMACPACGNRFYSDFRLSGANRPARHNEWIHSCEPPTRLWRRIARFFSH